MTELGSDSETRVRPLGREGEAFQSVILTARRLSLALPSSCINDEQSSCSSAMHVWAIFPDSWLTVSQRAVDQAMRRVVLTLADEIQLSSTLAAGVFACLVANEFCCFDCCVHFFSCQLFT